jgi:hypothetical protein
VGSAANSINVQWWYVTYPTMARDRWPASVGCTTAAKSDIYVFLATFSK